MNQIIYTAEFVKNPEELLKMFPPKHKRVFAHHSTIAFKPNDLAGIEVGKESSLKVVARVYDEKGDALLVENSKSKNQYPHITLSCAEGVSPVYSNELIKKAVESGRLEYLAAPYGISVVEGYSDGKNDFIK
jgi:Fungal tRNA ligase phosphodiesterase domain.